MQMYRLLINSQYITKPNSDTVRSHVPAQFPLGVYLVNNSDILVMEYYYSRLR